MSGIIRPGIDELHHINVSHTEGGLAITEIMIPFSDEAFVEAKVPDLCQPAVELHEPDFECSCIM